jgi:nucleotide-binding universal stress UspA family protein
LISTGRAHTAILDAAKLVGADLIVMGSHRVRFRDLFVGTTVERVIREADAPVLMVNTDQPYDTVMIAADLSAASADAVTAARRLGLLSLGEVAVVHAFDAIAKSKLALAQVPKDRISRYVKEEQQKAIVKLKNFMRSVPQAPAGWTPYVEDGEPVSVIGAAVERVRPGLLIVGTRGRTGAARALLGSVTEELLGSTTVDVLAVSPRARRDLTRVAFGDGQTAHQSVSNSSGAEQRTLH